MSETYKGQHAEDSPPWLLQPFGRRWAEAFGQTKDNLADRMRQAVKARCALIAPPDALPLIGEERGLPRGFTEPEANYRARLASAHDVWRWAGTPYGLLRQFQLAGYTNVILQTQSGMQYQLGAGGALADVIISSIASPHLGGSPELWSDIAIIILEPWPTWWGGSAPADGSQDQKAVAALILKWKQAINRCVSLKVNAGVAWGVGGLTWGAFNYGSGSVTTWTPPAG